jgi:hypothetical protein
MGVEKIVDCLEVENRWLGPAKAFLHIDSQNKGNRPQLGLSIATMMYTAMKL